MILEDITRALIRFLRGRVCERVEVVSHRDFGELTGLPAVVLELPIPQEQRSEASNVPGRTVDLETGKAYMTNPPRVYTLQYGVTLAAGSPITTPAGMGILDLQTRYLMAFAESPTLEVNGQTYALRHEPDIVAGGIRADGPILTARSFVYVPDVVLVPQEVQEVYIVLERRFRYHKHPPDEAAGV